MTTMMTKTSKAKVENFPQLEPDAGVLQEFDRLREILAVTHQRIPALLAQQRDAERALGLNESAEFEQQLADVVRERETAVRRRSAAIAAITELEGPLHAERMAVEVQRQQAAAEAVKAFLTRYGATVGALQQLWEEGRVLSVTLRCEVPMALPVKVTTSVIDGTSRAQPIRADVAASVDAASVALGAKLDQLDGALALVNAIRQSRELDSRHHHLALQRGAPVERGGVYRVIQPFSCLADGLPFEAGALIDGSLIGSGMMHRLMVGRRFIQPVALEAA
jgi:hypothetical protein